MNILRGSLLVQNLSFCLQSYVCFRGYALFISESPGVDRNCFNQLLFVVGMCTEHYEAELLEVPVTQNSLIIFFMRKP